uniref:Uncharacterized protein n=1 Tax=Siphoviridae sp. ctn8e14 TaxID=2827936 RepID=A0A8S5T4C1_9CAUD|nr:MAG TPA: hypothetical protein [Siphoviridae sp. ctn8e14]
MIADARFWFLCCSWSLSPSAHRPLFYAGIFELLKYLLMIADARFWFLVMLCCHPRPFTPAMQHLEIFELTRCGMIQSFGYEASE